MNHDYIPDSLMKNEKRRLLEGFAKPGFLVEIKARGILKPQHIEHM